MLVIKVSSVIGIYDRESDYHYYSLVCISPNLG